MRFVSIAILVSITSVVSAGDFGKIGGQGARTYYGTNASAWVSRSCKIVAMGTTQTPLVYLSIADSERTHIFWSYSPTLVMNFEKTGTILVSDNMRSVSGTATFTNVAQGEGGIAQANLKLSAAGELERVEFLYVGKNEERVIDCGNLRKR